MKENQHIEFKQSWRDEYLQYVCGFANAQGGTLYIGVDDNGRVCGIDHADKLLENLPNQINQTMGLLAQVNLHTEDGKEYVSVHVEPSDQAISYRGKFYYRSGSTLQEMNGVALTDFLYKKNNTTWDQSVVEGAALDDLDSEAVDFFLREAVEAQRLDASAKELPMLQLLRKLKLVDKDDRMTMAALLLFGKDIERWNLMASFRIGRFQHSQANLLFHDNIVCPLIRMPDNVMWTLRSRYLVAPIHYEGLHRVEPLEIPEDALREIVCNAIVHKNYFGPHIQMRVWDDRMELWNYGLLPDDYTIEKLLQAHESCPRNPLIAQVFYLAGFIEQWGRGYEKIHDAFVREHLMQPVFEQARGGFLATIQREKFIAIQTGKYVEAVGESTLKNIVDGIVEGVNDGVNGGISEGVNKDVQRKLVLVLGTIHDYPGIKIPAIEQRTDIPKKTLERYISLLKSWNVIEFRGSFKTGGYYQLSSNA